VVAASTERQSIVVGSGPNGLAAAIVLARAGREVRVLEANETIGGGTRSAELTLPGFVHDVCSSAHPLAVASPFLQSLPLAEHGLSFAQPPVALAHPFEDGPPALLRRAIDATAATLGSDAGSYQQLLRPLVADYEKLITHVLAPLRPPRYPVALLRFAVLAVRSATGLANQHFAGEPARALFLGMAAHSMLRLDQPISASFGVVMAVLGHAVGWPVARGGSQRIADALVCYLRSLGGEIVTGTRVESMDDLPTGAEVLFDVTPRQLLHIAGGRLPSSYKRRLERFRYGPGVFKVDWALDRPIPWKAPECLQAGTVHLGASPEEIVASERTVWAGGHPERPFVILVQPSLFDPTRAPPGKHTAWGYCHVPNGSTFDVTARIEDQVERFAPGFRDRILGRHVMSPAALEAHDANHVGGDINGGVQDLWQLYSRPTLRLNPYTTPVPGLYLCSSSTPPGGGVHGMCGYYAAKSALCGMRAIIF
jgi:phytoene dehydrogenase-like protein